MRKYIAVVAVLGALALVEAAHAAHVRVFVAPWRVRPIVLAPRFVAAPIVVAAPVAVVVAEPGSAVVGTPVATAPAAVGKGFVDLDVVPAVAQVWVDGEYVGEGADFSGDPDYLKLSSGSHVITLAREGFLSQRFTIVVEPNRLITLDVKLMVSGGVAQTQPVSSDAPSSEMTAAVTLATPVTEEPPTFQLDMQKTGYLALTVQPTDASLYIDDEPFGVVSEYNGDESIVLREGPHKIQIIRPGYMANVQTVDIVTDATKDISVTLTKE